MAEPTFLSDLIEQRAEERGDRPYIFFQDRVVSFAEHALATRRVANALTATGAEPGEGVAILMGNCPEYLALVHGLPRGGFYSVPINVALKGDGLRYILEHSDASTLVIDAELWPKLEELGGPPASIRRVYVRAGEGEALPPASEPLASLLDGSEDAPRGEEAGALSMLIYTSGTTGLPKGVVSRVTPGAPQMMQMLASNWVRPDDVLYTCLPLFHGNALSLTAAPALAVGVPFGLETRFSASRFWEPIRRWGVTSFNALGAMIPILMKQPERPDDADNPVRVVFSAACPANLWRAFEERFGVRLLEGYGAVDGGGVLIMNLGDAPVGSVGKLPPHVEWKLVDEDDREVPTGEVGELITKVPEGAPRRVVEYYKNPEASDDKVRGGWIRSGDLFTADAEGHLFFVDRKTDSMRRRGENISSWEVEKVVEKHPDVAESAAFGVPSELGEDEVMVLVVPRPGRSVDPADLIRHCAAEMAYFMVPRFVEVVEALPRTETHRVKKAELKRRGVGEHTWDREREMPELQLK